MPRALTPPFAAFSLLLFCWFLVPAQKAWSQSLPVAHPADTVEISVQGRYQADPDTAVIAIDVRGQDRDLKKAYAAAQQQSEQVRKLLRDQGVSPEQAQLGSYQVQPNIDWKTRKLIDYTFASHIEVDLKDFSKIGPLVDAAGQAGLPAIDQVSFELKDMQKAREQAIADGYHKAFAEAQELARLAGRSIQKLQYAGVDVMEPTPVYPRPIMMARAAGSFAPPPTEQFTPQKITVMAQVRVSFQMAQ